MSKARTIPRPSWPIRSGFCRRCKVGDALNCRELIAKDHTTQPPARFSEASLTAALEERGIGRPSTYASIIDTILERRYVFKKGNALVPTWTAFSVSKLLELHLPNLVDYQFTAQMEDLLDAISRGESESNRIPAASFTLAKRQAAGLEGAARFEDSADRSARPEPVFAGHSRDGDRDEVFVRVGKFGPFIEHGERKASIPQDMPPDELTLAKALSMLEQASVGEEPLGIHPDTHKPVYLKQGRFGPYVQMGAGDEDEKPKNASLLAGHAADRRDV